jgi:O-antigen/teichoic acid export membrane protein
MLGPLIAWFYGEPRLKWITIVLAIAFIFGGLTVQHQALLRRQMRFTALAIIEVVSMLAGIIIAVASSLYGAGYWALVLNQLVVGVTMAMGVWIICEWRPSLPVRHSGVRSMLAFGGNLTGANVLNYFVRNFDNVLIGWYWGAQQLGLYTRAYQLLLLPIRHFNIPVSSIAIPVLSRLQSQPDRYRAYYCRGILLITMVGMPLVTFLFITSDKLVLAILGAQWLDAVVIFKVLAPAAFIGTFNVATGWIYVSLGQASRQLRWSVVSSTVTVMSFILGIYWGPVGVATTFTVSQLILQIPSILYCYRNSPLRLADLATTLFRPTYAAISAGIVLVIITRLLPIDTHVAIELLVSCLLYISLYLAFFVIPFGGKEILLEVLRMTKGLRQA